MKKFQQIIDLCNQEFGSRVLYTKIEQEDRGSTLFVSLDASHEAENNAFYPSIEKGELKVYETWSNTLNLYMHANNKVHFYYQGYVHTDKNGKKYSEPFDEDGREIDAENVFSLELNAPEEALEWLRFIFKYRDGSVPEETRSIEVEEHPASRWFEEPRVFIPGVTDKLVPISKAMAAFNVFDLPALYDKAHHLGGRSLDEMNDDFDRFTAEISAMNKEGQAELAEIGKIFNTLAADSRDHIQPGDFMALVGSKGRPFTWSQYLENSEDFADLYLLVLRPAWGVSYPAIYDFLYRQEEGGTFIGQLMDAPHSLPATMKFIPEPEAQQQFILTKKTGLYALQEQLDRLKDKRMSPAESLLKIEDAGRVLAGLLRETVVTV